jgi:hypothetical protein
MKRILRNRDFATIITKSKKRMWYSAAFMLFAAISPASLFAQNGIREWSDSTGKHKIKGRLVEVRDGVVYLKTSEGKSVNVPLTRLSEADQDFLKNNSDNPFQETDAMESGDTASSKNSASTSSTASTKPDTGVSDATAWSGQLKIDWSEVEELNRDAEGNWDAGAFGTSDDGLVPKRSTLMKKMNFFEGIRRFHVNTTSKRGVVGYTVSFSVPKPLSRLSLIDFASGKAIHTDPIEGDMCPLCLLHDGATVLMQGTSDERKGFETPDMLQLWRVAGKKVNRTASWIPFPDEHESFGKKTNAAISEAISFPNNRLVILGNNGHMACVDSTSGKPYWHTRLSKDYAICPSNDNRWLVLVDGSAILIVDPQTGSTQKSFFIEGNPHMGWTRVRCSPSGEKLAVSFQSECRILDLKSEEWLHKISYPNLGPIAPNGLLFPNDDYLLLNNTTLVHIPSQIKVCELQQVGGISSFGSTTLIAIQGDSGGVVLPTTLPHASAAKALASAEKDPDVFLVRPGVKVSIDVSGAGQYAEQIRNSLTKAATKANYAVENSSPIKLVGSVTGPKQEAVSYIAAGSYVVNSYQSTIKLQYEGTDLWQTGATNIPGMISTSRDETIQSKLEQLGKSPNLTIFENISLPVRLQKPRPTANGNSAQSLVVTEVTLNGLVDK